MSIPDYGATGLPLPLRDGYVLNPVEKIRSTDMDAGRAVQRWEFDDAPVYLQASWIFSEPEARLFVAWTNQVAKAGWFTMRLVTPMGFDDLTVRLRSTPEKGELVAQYSWRYSAVIEIEFEPMLEEGWAEILPDYILFADIFDYAMNREWPLEIVNTPELLLESGAPFLMENGVPLLLE